MFARIKGLSEADWDMNDVDDAKDYAELKAVEDAGTQVELLEVHVDQGNPVDSFYTVRCPTGYVVEGASWAYLEGDVAAFYEAHK